MRCTERLFLNEGSTKLVAEGDPRGAFLYAAPGDEIPESAVKQFGLVDGGLPRKVSPPAAPKPPATKAPAKRAEKGGTAPANKGAAKPANKGGIKPADKVIAPAADNPPPADETNDGAADGASGNGGATGSGE